MPIRTSRKIFLIFYLTLLLILFSSTQSFADFGCNIGSAVYGGPSGTFPLISNPSNELFSGSEYHVVTHSGDSRCGITANIYNFNGKQCVVAKSGGGYYYGNVIVFTQENINCAIDDYVPVMLLAVAGLSAVVIRKQFSSVSCLFN